MRLFDLFQGRKSVDRELRLGLMENWHQFSLLVALNLFVGGMIGLERTILPVLAEAEFGITSKTAAISFIATFGISKALSNLFAGNLAQRVTRRRILIAGWLFGLPVPIILIWAPDWGWVIGANVLLGINQGLTWSMTVNMKMDLVGPRWRGLALGFNETAGYLSLAAAAFLTGVIAQSYGLRPEPFYLGIGIAAIGLALSVFLVRDTAPYLALETARQAALDPDSTSTAAPAPVSLRRSFADTTWRRRDLFGITQAGFVKNLNDGLAWGIFPLFFASHGLDPDRIGILVAIYPMVWGSLQIASGWVSDVLGRAPLIVTGMLLQDGAICLAGLVTSFGPWAGAMVLLGLGTAMVYPTLLAAIGDAVPARERATSLGVYRFWRDTGFVAAALSAGGISDLFGLRAAIFSVGALTMLSGILASLTLRDNRGNP
jgi:MFS family permease